MANTWTALWQRVFGPKSNAGADVERIAVLQQAAVARRAEYAQEQERAAQDGNDVSANRLSASRAGVADAEAAHIAALQAWQNKQSRQKSR